jgi:hypothetical protein
VPYIEDRNKISFFRRKACKKTFSTNALNAPIHISLTKTSEIKNYDLFESEIVSFLKKQKPFYLLSKKYTGIIKERFCCGINFYKNKNIVALSKSLDEISNKYIKIKKHIIFNPHITYTFPGKVDFLDKEKVPIYKLYINRVSILQQNQNTKKYKILKHIYFGK